MLHIFITLIFSKAHKVANVFITFKHNLHNTQSFYPMTTKDGLHCETLSWAQNALIGQDNTLADDRSQRGAGLDPTPPPSPVYICLITCSTFTQIPSNANNSESITDRVSLTIER